MTIGKGRSSVNQVSAALSAPLTGIWFIQNRNPVTVHSPSKVPRKLNWGSSDAENMYCGLEEPR
jgi:hypothetical protein